MKTIFLVALFASQLVGHFAFAGQAPSDSQELVIPDFSKVNAPAKNSNSNIHVTCKTAEGHTYKSDEPGYEACLSSAQKDAANKNQNANGAQSGNSSSVNLQFGK